jgi:hypothetical protein
LVPLRTVRICLAKMTKDGLVHSQEVAKRNDRTPQNTWFFWGVRLEKTYATIVEFIYRSMYNLVLRRARGVDENEDMVRRYETSGGVNFLPPVSDQCSTQVVARHCCCCLAKIFTPSPPPPPPLPPSTSSFIASKTGGIGT